MLEYQLYIREYKVDYIDKFWCGNNKWLQNTDCNFKPKNYKNIHNLLMSVFKTSFINNPYIMNPINEVIFIREIDETNKTRDVCINSELICYKNIMNILIFDYSKHLFDMKLLLKFIFGKETFWILPIHDIDEYNTFKYNLMLTKKDIELSSCCCYSIIKNKEIIPYIKLMNFNNKIELVEKNNGIS